MIDILEDKNVISDENSKKLITIITEFVGNKKY